CGQPTLNGKTKFWGNGYTYDAWGNLTGKGNLPGANSPKCNPESMDRPADAQNRMHVKPNSGADFQYDAAGNMTYNADAGQYYSYDAESRITGAGGLTYTYAARGNRVEKATATSPPTGTLYWYMSSGIVAESDLNGILTSEYVFFDGKRVARRDGVNGAGGVFYYFSDHLKTASVITDAAGNIKSESDYYPWGGELQFTNNDSNHYKFTGKERDSETGLDYFGARYYSNGLGRWVSADWSRSPIPVPYADFGDPQSLNLYTYVRNIPTAGYDVDGHQSASTGTGFVCVACVENAVYAVMEPKQYGIGMAKEGGSFALHTSLILLGAPGIVANHFMGEPKALQPTNAAQAAGKTATAVFLTLATFALPGPKGAGAVEGAAEGAGAVTSYEVGTYGALRARSVVGDGLVLDHIPSNASNIARAEAALGR